MLSRHQSEVMLCLDELVSQDHPYRAYDSLFNWAELSAPFAQLYSHQVRREYGIERVLGMLILQFTEDVSDRDMERLLKENVAAKWFCQFGLTEKTPDHSSFGVFRKTLGTQGLMAIFGKVRDALKAQGLICEVFTFVDASQLVSKLSTWSERNKAIAKGLEKFNNATASKVQFQAAAHAFAARVTPTTGMAIRNIPASTCSRG